MAHEKQGIKSIIVELAPGVRVTVTGAAAKAIAHLAKHADYYNDPDTVGNFTLITKGETADIKASVAIAQN